jgi:hypothetical protein
VLKAIREAIPKRLSENLGVSGRDETIDNEH